MRWLLFLSRLAFVCNLFFLLAVSIQATRWIQNEDLESTIIIVGYLMVAVLNPVVNLLYLLLFFAGRQTLKGVPRWLRIGNIFFLLLQILYLIFLNDR